MSAEKNKKAIQEGRAVLGIELGSTRIMLPEAMNGKTSM